MPTKWLDKTQPQTLYIATILMYINAALSLLVVAEYSHVTLFGVHHGLLLLELLLIAGQVGGGLGIANEKNWGYLVAVVAAIGVLLASLSVVGGSLINLIFEVALVALLLHPQSREYRRIWFR